jgi:hypothetical protein
MSDKKLTAPRLQILMVDGTQYEVQVTNADLVAFDRERARHRDWPSVQDGPSFHQNFVGWRAATRTEVLSMTLTQFEKEVAFLKPMEDDEDDEVDPTPPAAAPTWSSPSP